MLSHIFEFYSRNGESLSSIGLYEAVLPLKNTIGALDLFLTNHLLVLGGDLYIKNTLNDFEPFYADWYYDGRDYAQSIQEAKDYLSQFDNQDLYVSFILK